jgi:hypothetical protein
MSGGYVRAVDNTATQHDGTEGLAINDSLVRRFLTIFALNTTRRVYGYNGPCVPFSKHLIAKTGPFALDPHPEASKMEITRQRWWGDWVTENAELILPQRERI